MAKNFPSILHGQKMKDDLARILSDVVDFGYEKSGTNVVVSPTTRYFMLAEQVNGPHEIVIRIYNV